MKTQVAVQLYSIREAMENDFLGTLKKVSEIGYKGVEFAGFGGLDALELKAYLERLGLEPVGAHIGLEQLENSLEEVIEYNVALGTKYIVCPWADFNSKEDYLKLARTLEEVGAKLNDAGLKLCYHNHAHEFEVYDGEYGLDIIFNNTSRSILQTEIDTYWVTYANIDPVQYVKKYSGRTPLVHIKDMAANRKESTEIGNGVIDVEAIIKQSMDNGAEWVIVEQEAFERSPLESIEISYNNIKNMNLL